MFISDRMLLLSYVVYQCVRLPFGWLEEEFLNLL